MNRTTGFTVSLWGPPLATDTGVPGVKPHAQGNSLRDWIDVLETTRSRESLDLPVTFLLRHRQRNEAVVTTAVAPSSPLTAADRCDRCGAQAYLRVELQSGGELLFCAHHAREHGDKLKEIAVTLVDETDKLTDTKSAPSDER
jgi:hypothetical protein